MAELAFLWGLSESQGLVLIVSLDEAFDDGTGLPEGNADVGVFDGWDTAVDVDSSRRVAFSGRSYLMARVSDHSK